MAEFVRLLAATQSVAVAARGVGMSRQSAYRLRARQQGEPFDLAWEAAVQGGYDALHQAALDRALNGVEVPVYHRGELVGSRRAFDERLTVFLLSAQNRHCRPREYWREHDRGHWSGRLADLIELVRRGEPIPTADDELDEEDEAS